MSGLQLLHILMISYMTRAAFWFESTVIIWLGISSFISLVCLGYSQEWESFSWILISFIPTLTCAVNLFSNSKGAVQAESHGDKSKILNVCRYSLKTLFVLIISLLTAGNILGAISYSAPGSPISVFFNGAGQNGTLQVYCIGSTNASKPSIFFFSSAAHGIVDFYGLQYYISSSNGTNRRVCIHDPLGFGWSQDPFNGQFTNYEYLYRLMISSGEPQPWHIVGWGGGGSALMYLANNHTSSIKSVLGQEEISNYRTKELSSRGGLVQLILSIAIPWGLIGIFIPISPREEGYYPPEKWSEFRVQMWKSKVWISQYQGIQNLQTTPYSQDPLSGFAPLPSNIRVFGVYCNVTLDCNSQDCSETLKQNIYYNTKKFALIKKISENATIALNVDDDCDLGLPVLKPKFTAESIIKLYSGIE